MKIAEIVKNLGLEVKVQGDAEREVRGCYVSDLLSDVLANSSEGNLWITRQTHSNIVAVAAIKGLAGIIITGNKAVDPDTIAKAGAEKIPIMSIGKSTFEAAGIFYKLLAG
jgi:predicted transcriptional regulator